MKRVQILALAVLGLASCGRAPPTGSNTSNNTISTAPDNTMSLQTTSPAVAEANSSPAAPSVGPTVKLPGGIEFALGASLSDFQAAYPTVTCNHIEAEVDCIFDEDTSILVTPKGAKTDQNADRKLVGFKNGRAESFAEVDVSKSAWEAFVRSATEVLGRPEIDNADIGGPLPGVHATHFAWRRAYGELQASHGVVPSEDRQIEIYSITLKPVREESHAPQREPTTAAGSAGVTSPNASTDVRSLNLPPPEPPAATGRSADLANTAADQGPN